MLVHCPTCNVPLGTGARFCMECGARVEVDPEWDATAGEQLKLALGSGFTVLGELGRGGFAVVYLVREIKKKQYLAVKVMRPNLVGPARVRERFHRETELVARLQHEHIVPILFSGESRGLVYYAMPRVRGNTLSHLIKRDGALPIDQSVAIIGTLAKGLTYAHGQGIVHRDVKPANILIGENGHLSIVDFGIAKALTEKGQSLSITGEIIGSADYMSPERVEGAPEVDHRADIYSLGIVAFEMLTGQKPFVAETVYDMLIKQVEEPAPRVRSLRPEVSPMIDAAVNQCLAKVPAERWHSAEAAARALGASL